MAHLTSEIAEGTRQKVAVHEQNGHVGRRVATAERDTKSNIAESLGDMEKPAPLLTKEDFTKNELKNLKDVMDAVLSFKPVIGEMSDVETKLEPEIFELLKKVHGDKLFHRQLHSFIVRSGAKKELKAALDADPSLALESPLWIQEGIAENDPERIVKIRERLKAVTGIIAYFHDIIMLQRWNEVTGTDGSKSMKKMIDRDRGFSQILQTPPIRLKDVYPDGLPEELKAYGASPDLPITNELFSGILAAIYMEKIEYADGKKAFAMNRANIATYLDGSRVKKDDRGDPAGIRTEIDSPDDRTGEHGIINAIGATAPTGLFNKLPAFSGKVMEHAEANYDITPQDFMKTYGTTLMMKQDALRPDSPLFAEVLARNDLDYLPATFKNSTLAMLSGWREMAELHSQNGKLRLNNLDSITELDDLREVMKDILEWSRLQVGFFEYRRQEFTTKMNESRLLAKHPDALKAINELYGNFENTICGLVDNHQRLLEKTRLMKELDNGANLTVESAKTVVRDLLQEVYAKASPETVSLILPS